jgi:hypothetical protein
MRAGGDAEAREEDSRKCTHRLNYTRDRGGSAPKTGGLATARVLLATYRNIFPIDPWQNDRI